VIKLYNTLTRKIEDFSPVYSSEVGIYACGPTVYDYTHIGHLRKYVGDDILRRVLEANGYTVKHVMNITDVGHLVSDEDSGEDKMEKGARESGRTVWEVAKFYEEYFWNSVGKVNIERPNIVAKATEHIQEQIKLIQKLEKNGFTYITDEAIYFDISKFENYTKLSGQKLEEKEVGVRAGVVIDSQKKNPGDFALWFFTVGHFKDHSMKWSSPWGEGFPGWHIECSAMSMEYLGDSFDIHTGGIDHIAVHHTNEIAQSEAATGKQFVKYWVHHNFLNMTGEKMSKSKKNFYKVEDLEGQGIEALALRYLIFTTHYRERLNFSFESLTAAATAFSNLKEEIRLWEQPKGSVGQYYQRFLEAANFDLSMPKALAVLWELVKSDLPTSAKSRDLLEMDKILGLGLEQYIGKKIEVPEEVMHLVRKREQARNTGNFQESDQLRREIKKLGFEVEDTPQGPSLKKV
jgi:cysteinyl-tRNA synthetase